MRRRKPFVALAGLAVVGAVGAVLLWLRPNRITHEKYTRLCEGARRADVLALLGPPSNLSKADVLTIVHTETVEVYSIRAYKPGATTGHEESLVWTQGDGVIEVTFWNGQLISTTWVQLPGLVECAKRHWHRWFPEK